MELEEKVTDALQYSGECHYEYYLKHDIFRRTETETIGHLFCSNNRVEHTLAAGCKTDTADDAKTTDGYKDRQYNVYRERSEGFNENIVNIIPGRFSR